jgi:hypothetical protein
MGDLTSKLAAAQAEVARLQREIAQGPCREYGHTWKSIGGANAGCCDDCHCSVPVHVCEKCGDCDYGENDDAKAIRIECAEIWFDLVAQSEDARKKGE